MAHFPYSLDTRPAIGLVAITPTDGTGLQWPAPIRGFTAAGAGNVAVVAIDGSTATVAVLAGVVYQIAAQRISGSGTTATGIVGLI